MNKQHFYSFGQLNVIIADPKKDVQKNLNFRHIAHFKYTKDSETYSFQFKLTVDDDFPFSTCHCSFLGKGRPPRDLQKVLLGSILNTGSVQISAKKMAQSADTVRIHTT